MHTILHDKHVALGAKMVDFHGWEMPVRYSKGTLQEHKAVREHVGLFDISHMGRIVLFGKDAGRLLDYLSTGDVRGMKERTTLYTVWCNEKGGSVDDLLVFKENNERYFVVVNASNRTKDVEHLLRYASDYNVHVISKFNEEGILAIQGPESLAILKKKYPEVAFLKKKEFLMEEGVIISRTGYTGALGFEIYATNDKIVELWDDFMSENVEPIGLGARDTLRLEMGYALYGHELTEEIAPNESVAAFAVNQDKLFLGKEFLNQKNRKSYGILLDEGIQREGSRVLKEGQDIGYITSGNFSPSLKKGVALILVEGILNIGDTVTVQGKMAKVVNLPFWRSDVKI